RKRKRRTGWSVAYASGSEMWKGPLPARLYYYRDRFARGSLMPRGQLHPLIRYIRRLAGPEPGGGLTDAELLERYLSQRDQAAFEVLLWRHGPMVLATCRRLLHHPPDVEDAFQATFLVFARKVGSIRN